MVQGPNVKRLIVRKMSLLAVPPGGGMADGLAFLMSPERMTAAAREATQWVEAAIAAVKAAPNNPFGDDDEAIAGEVLRQVEERDAARRPSYRIASSPPEARVNLTGWTAAQGLDAAYRNADELRRDAERE